MNEEVRELTNLEKLRNRSIDEVARDIDTCEYTELQDRICLEMCPEQDCDIEKAGGCVECIKKWLKKECK